MKKFKKLAAVMVAVVTLMATAINACAAVCNGETYHWFNQIKSSYYVANNTLHYSDFFSWENNYIYFANMDKGLMEGNVIFSIDISNYITSTLSFLIIYLLFLKQKSINSSIFIFFNSFS